LRPLNQILFYFILWIIFPGQLSGTETPNDSSMEAYNLILQLRFAEAKNILEIQKKYNEEETYVNYLENLKDFLEVIITEESGKYIAYKENSRKRIESIRKRGNMDSPYHLFLQAEMHIHSFLVNFKFQDIWKAAIHFYSSYRLIEENNTLFPDFKPNAKIMGIQKIILGSVPDNYYWIMRIAGLEGSMVEGVEYLKEYHEFTRKSVYPELEAIMILAHVYIQNSTNDTDALDFMQSLSDKPMENSLFRFTYILALNRAGMNHEVISIFEENPQNSNELPFQFLEFLYGEAKLNRFDDDAYIPLEAFLSKFNGLHYIKSAWHKLSWYYLLHGNREKYKECKTMVRNAGVKMIDADKQALHESTENMVPNLILLKARLFFDGGYYKDAEALLLENHSEKNYRTPAEKLEYFYRLARISHKSGDLKKAEKYYRLVLNTGEELPFYYASYSALQLGKIFETKGDSNQAVSYYETALKLRNGPYKNSIGHKARSAIEKIENQK